MRSPSEAPTRVSFLCYLKAKWDNLPTKYTNQHSCAKVIMPSNSMSITVCCFPWFSFLPSASHTYGKFPHILRLTNPDLNPMIQKRVPFHYLIKKRSIHHSIFLISLHYWVLHWGLEKERGTSIRESKKETFLCSSSLFPIFPLRKKSFVPFRLPFSRGWCPCRFGIFCTSIYTPIPSLILLICRCNLPFNLTARYAWCALCSFWNETHSSEGDNVETSSSISDKWLIMPQWI